MRGNFGKTNVGLEYNNLKLLDIEQYSELTVNFQGLLAEYFWCTFFLGFISAFEAPMKFSLSLFFTIYFKNPFPSKLFCNNWVFLIIS